MTLDAALLKRLELPFGGRHQAILAAGTRDVNNVGAGLDVMSSRPYEQGDDPRTIDWPASARTGELHSRVTRAQRGGRVHIVLGGGGRMLFGKGRSKWETALMASQTLASIARLAQDSVSVHVCGAELRTYHLSGRLHDRLALLAMLAKDTPAETASGSLAQTVLHLVHGKERRGSIIAISDSFVAQDEVEVLVQAHARHSLAYLEVYDPYEWHLPSEGRFSLHGGSRSAAVKANFYDRSLRHSYATAVAEHRQSWQQFLTTSGIPSLTVSTRDDVLASLARQLPRRR